METVAEATPIRSLAFITSIAFSLSNFRGPLIQALVASGVRVFALAPDHDEKSRLAIRALGAEPVDYSLSRTGMHPARDFLDALKLAALLRRLKVDATFAYFVKPVIYGSLAARLVGIRKRFSMLGGLGYVFTAGPDETVKRRALRTLVSNLFRVAFLACHRVFFQNHEDAAQFTATGLLHPSKAVLISGTGVDLAAFAAQPPVPDPPTFLLMARLLREKGIVEYAKAARYLKQAHPEARFILLGGVDSNPGGLSLGEVESWAHEGIIEWHGHVEDVRPWIASAGVYVLPSYREGKPRSTQEAMAMGRPIVTTDTTGCRDTVVEGVNGFLVPVGEWRPLAEAMRRFIADPALIGKMGKESRRLAEELFDIHKINAQILDVMGVERHELPHPAETDRLAALC